MSYANYWHCVSCDRKTVYSADVEDHIHDGVVVVTLCEECAKTKIFAVVDKDSHITKAITEIYPGVWRTAE